MIDQFKTSISMAESNTDNTVSRENTPKTVKFNVGGKHFEVSRDLIMNDEGNETMLSRLVSDTWLQDPEERVFIDRNGDNFLHVLDYLRYGEVTLPLNISLDSFMKDMDYYGISVQEGSVRKENDYFSAKIEAFNDMINENKRKKQINEEKEKSLIYEKKHYVLAIDILREFTEKSTIFFLQNLVWCYYLYR